MGTTFKEAKIGQIPTDWKLVKFEDIGVTYGGLTNKNKGDFGKGKPYIPFLNIMNNAKIDLDYFDYVDVQEGEKQNRAKKGDLFFNTSSETPEEVGMCSVLCDDVPELYLNSFCFGFRIEDQNSLLPLFVSYFFRSGVGRKVIFPLAQGMTRYNLSKRYFLQLEIPKPKTEEQRKIAEILSTVDEVIEKTDAIIQEAQQLKKGLMRKLFTEGIGHTQFKLVKSAYREMEIPLGWANPHLGKVVSKIIDFRGKTPIKLGMEWGNGDIVALSANNVEMGRINLEKECYYGSEELYRKWMTQGDTRKGDIVFTMEAPLGNAALIPDDKKYILSQRVILLRPDEKTLTNTYLLYFLSSRVFREYLHKYSSGSTALGTQQKTLVRIPVLLPSVDEQKQINEILSEVDAKTEKEQAFRSELEQLKKGLMQVLLTGKVRVKV